MLVLVQERVEEGADGGGQGLMERWGGSCEWKPLVDNPHCRFRHYVLQPLTQAQVQPQPSTPNPELYLKSYSAPDPKL